MPITSHPCISLRTNQPLTTRVNVQTYVIKATTYLRLIDIQRQITLLFNFHNYLIIQYIFILLERSGMPERTY